MLNPRVAAERESPISATYALLDAPRADLPLLDLGQAAPAYPPAPEVVEHVATVARRPGSAGYVPTAGLPALREAFAADLSTAYRAGLRPADAVVTAGCNQAFCLVATALAEPGDEIVVPLPYYFNHDMWLRMNGIRPVYVPPGADMRPDVAAVAEAVTPRTKAVLLVTPSNPTGAICDPATIAAFAALADARGLMLILDETYRSFRGTDEPAHGLFADGGWSDTVVSLHSFSKDLALPGYRVGAVVGSGRLLRAVEKLLDCVAVCAPRIGQEAAWAGLTHAGGWRRDRAREVADRHRRFRAVMAGRPGGFELLSSGAYFGWLRHPFTGTGIDGVVRLLALRHGMLLLPGTAFEPDDTGTLRASYANLAPAAIEEFAARLAAFTDQDGGGTVHTCVTDLAS